MKKINLAFSKLKYTSIKSFASNYNILSNSMYLNTNLYVKIANVKLFSSKESKNIKHGTTVLVIRRDSKVTMIADGLMTLGSIRFKTDTVKIRKLTENIICGFAGSVADSLTLLELLETEIEATPADLMRACVNLAKTWKTNKTFRRINATLIVSDGNVVLNLDGEGNVIEIKDGILGIGSGGLYAQCAAKALVSVADELKLTNEDIVKKAMDIATDLCIYSNKNYVIEELKYIRH